VELTESDKHTSLLYHGLITYECPEQARMFVPGWPFKPSIMFVGDVRNLPQKVIHSGRLRPYSQTLDKAERSYKNKASLGLYHKTFYSRNKFLNILS
jgi:hypothetical protein